MSYTIMPRPFWPLSNFWEDQDDFLPAAAGGVSISEDDKSVYITAAVPGVDEKDIEVTFDKGVLWVKGETKEETTHKKFYRKAASSFSYRIAVPGDINPNAEPEATYKNGVMTISFAKSPQREPKRITVKKV